jgi:hypothetical protein
MDVDNPLLLDWACAREQRESAVSRCEGRRYRSTDDVLARMGRGGRHPRNRECVPCFSLLTTLPADTLLPYSPLPSHLRRALAVMRDEIETTLRLLGVTKISQLGPHLLNTRALDPLIAQSVQVGEDEQGFY